MNNKMREIYFDNAATTKVCTQACDVIMQTISKDYGNPSSLHLKGITAENYIKEARAIFANLLKVNEKEFVFTSGGTESNNMALIGAAMANCRRGKHIITTAIEHPSVSAPLAALKAHGFEVTQLPVDEKGVVSLKALEKAIREDTIMVSSIYVNNEIGTIQPIEQMGRLIKRINGEALFHVDAIQAFGKFHIYPKRYGIDLMTISSHKFHGPKGVGLLYIREGTKVKPILLGGGQQKGMRSGTENVPGVAGMAHAAKTVYENLTTKVDGLYGLRAYFIRQLMSFEDVVINSNDQEVAAPHIVSAAFGDIKAEVLLHALEERGIYVSSGSACSSNHPAVSVTLKAIGVNPKYLDATVRFSFSYETTKEEMDDCLKALAELVPMLRRYTPGGKKRV